MRRTPPILAAAAALLALGASLAAAAEVTQQDGVRVSVAAKMAPSRLPRAGSAPIAVTVAGRIYSTEAGVLPQLRGIRIAINRNGRFDYRGLPACRLGQIQPSTNRGALAACRRSLIGAGSFSADVRIPAQSPFPSQGKVLAFNGSLSGRPAILAHIYGTEPAPTSYVLPFLMRRSHGTYGTVLEASLHPVTGEWGFVTGISMTLGRSFSFRGRTHSYLTAGCPAPAGFPGAVFPLLRTSFAFAGGLNLNSTLTRSCKVKG